MDTFHIASLAVQISNGSNRSVMMADERKPQDEPEEKVKESEEQSKELSEEQLDKVAGGFSSVSNVLKTRHDTAKNSISNVR